MLYITKFKFEYIFGDNLFEIYYPISCLLKQNFQDIIHQSRSSPRCHYLHQFYCTVFWMEMVWNVGLAVRSTCFPAFPCSKCLPLCPEGQGARDCAFRLPSHSPERCRHVPGLLPMSMTHTGQGCVMCVCRDSKPT